MDNVSVRYVPLATVSVRQAFYANGVARKSYGESELDFGIEPTAECAETMRRLDILFRTSGRLGGATLLARALGKNAGGDDIMRFAPANTDKLTFWMRLRNADALNFDDLPAQFDPDGIYYFTNQQPDAGAPRDDLHLTAAAAGVDGAHDRIVRATENYTFHHNAVVAPGTAKVVHLLTGAALESVSVFNKGGESDLAFDLRPFPLGRCELWIAGAEKDDFYFAGSAEDRGFGVIELVLGSTLAPNYRIVEPDRSLTKARPAYTIRLRNRLTRWRYTIQLSPTGPIATALEGMSDAEKADFLSHLDIITNDDQISFTRTETTSSKIVFVSDADVALREQYNSSNDGALLALSLNKNVAAGSDGDVVRSSLPYPPNSLIDARAAPPIFSDAFLTI